MAKEILLYGDINKDLAVQVITDLNSAINKDISVRVNTPGGSVPYIYGMIAKFAEHPKNKHVMVDGMAYSGGFYFTVFADYVEALNVSNFLLHRAAYPSWIENDPEFMEDPMRNQLIEMNAKLEDAVSNKIDIKALQEIMNGKPELRGARYKDIFSLDNRIDVFLNAEEAKAIGVVNKIINITPDRQKEIKANMSLMVAKYNELPTTDKPIEIEIPKPNKIMDLNTLKNSHPALYNEVFALGKADGIAAEKDRVQAWVEFVDIDAKAVSEGIASDKAPTHKSIAEFAKKSMAKELVASTAKDAPPAIVTPEAGAIGGALSTEEKAKADAIAKFDAEVKAELEAKLKRGSI